MTVSSHRTLSSLEALSVSSEFSLCTVSSVSLEGSVQTPNFEACNCAPELQMSVDAIHIKPYTEKSIRIIALYEFIYNVRRYYLVRI